MLLDLRADAARAGREPLDRGADGGAVALRARAARGDGFWSGLPVGGALGFVYAPCAGPILAAVISVSASRGTTGELVAVARRLRARARPPCCSSIALGGRRVLERVRRGAARAGRAARVRRGDGADRGADVRQPRHPLSERAGERVPRLPDEPDRLDRALERRSRTASPTCAASRSSRRRPRSASAPAPAGARRLGRGAAGRADARPAGARRRARVPADTQRWFNSPPLTMKRLRGRVVLIDFWTYTCINCLRTLPYIRAWDERYRDEGLTIVGVHTPEFAFEREAANVQRAIGDERLRYPVVQDNEFGTWNAFTNQGWPSKFLIDATRQGPLRAPRRGRVRGDRGRDPHAARRGRRAQARRGGASRRARSRPSAHRATAETYLGSARAQGFSPVGPTDGTRDYTAARGDELPQSVFSLGGRWRVDAESAARGARRVDHRARRRDRRLPRAVVRRRPAAQGPRAPRRQADLRRPTRAPTSATAS